MVTPTTVESVAARKPMTSEGRAPYTQRAKRSRPRRGSMPNQWSEVAPIVGKRVLGDRGPGSARCGVCPSSLQSSGAKIATSTKNSTIAKQTIATLSCRSRSKAIWTGERPCRLSPHRRHRRLEEVSLGCPTAVPVLSKPSVHPFSVLVVNRPGLRHPDILGSTSRPEPPRRDDVSLPHRFALSKHRDVHG